MYKIYKITNLLNQKIYVGYTKRSLQRRFREHLYWKTSAKKSLLRDAIKKYGPENFEIEEIESSEDKNYIMGQNRENFWINFYDSNNPKIGYNIAQGGLGGNTGGHPTSEEHKEKLKKLWTGCKRWNNGIIERYCKESPGPDFIRGSLRTKKTHPEWCKKLSINKKGKKFSETHLAAIRNARKKSRKKILCIETGEVFESVKEASLKTGIKRNGITSCCNKRLKSSGGYTWKYAA